MNIEQLDELNNKCTGCQACAQICPQSVIEMKYSEDGFLYPKINKNLCTNCSLCIHVCDICKKKDTIITKGIFSVQAKDKEIVRESSSGGVFKILAEYFLENGGLVFGAAFDAARKEVKHYSTDQVSIERLMKSKYVQSNIGEVYKDVEKALKDDRKVLFCGTPCQIRGLISYLKWKKIKGNLLTVDFMCHGVPSPLFFREFLVELENKYHSKVVDITFREKDFGWRKQAMKVYFENGEVWKNNSNSTYFYFYFLHNYSLRDSCYECEEYNTHSSDLTLADDWFSECEKDDIGTSLVFINTEEGKKMFGKISDKLQIQNVKDSFENIDIYSHKNYSHRNKELWMEALKTKGFLYVTGTMYKKCTRMMTVKRLVNKILNFTRTI